MIIVYDLWFRHEKLQCVPPKWIKIGEWAIQNNVFCGGDLVSFYAVKDSEKERLIDNLRLFSYMLPRTFRQTSFHMMMNNSLHAVKEP